MSQRKRFMSAVLLVLLAITLTLSGCGTGGATGGASSGAASTAANAAPTEIVIGFFMLTDMPTDFQAVIDELNKVLVEKANVKIKSVVTANFGNYHDTISLMLSGNEQIDTFLAWGGDRFLSYYSKGQIVELDDLLKNYGSGITAAVGDRYLAAGRINGKQYGLTTNRDLAVERGFYARKDIMDKYGYKAEDIKTLDDFAKVLATVKEKEPGMLPLAASGSIPLLDTICDVDTLGDGYGVLANYGQDDLKVINRFATDDYKKYCEYFRTWYKNGYITEDVMTSTDDSVALMKAGKAFAGTTNLKPGFETKQSATVGTEVVSIPMIPCNTSTSIVQSVQWFIARNSKVPEATMKFLNLMYSDPQVTNLMAWGIEGKHYVKTANGQIKYPDGVTADNIGYDLNLGWMFGNQYQTYVWETDPADLYVQLKKFNDSAIMSKAFGFTFNPESVKTEIAAVSAACSEYRSGLEYGVLDTATALPEFLKKLENAGIDKVIAEKQKQLDAWSASK